MMRAAFGHKTCAVYFDADVKRTLEEKFPSSRWRATYDPRLRALKLTAGGSRGSLIRRQTTPIKGKTYYVMGWERDFLPSGGRNFPTFSVLDAEDVQIVSDGVLVIIPPENKRLPAMIIKRRTKAQLTQLKTIGATKHVGHSNEIPQPAAQPKKLDLLDALRHHRDALNNLRARHPEIGFRVAADGRLSVELLLTE